MDKLSFFPSPADGETVYSIMCRISERTRWTDGFIISSVTGQRLLTPILSALPGYIGNISRAIPSGHNWNDAMKIVTSHTSLPYFIYFLPEQERHEWATRLVAEKFSNRIAMALGLYRFPIAVTTQHPRYCPKCAEEQILKIGFSFYSRHHQLPGVFVCSRHKEILSHGCNVCGPYPLKSRGLSMPGRCKCEITTPLPVITPLKDITPLYWIARESEYMVNSFGTGHSDPRAVLKEVAIQKGFRRGSVIDYCKLAAGIEARFGKDLLQLLCLQVWNNAKPAAWIRQSLLKSGNNINKASILFLLIVGVLFDSLEDFETCQKCKEVILVNRGKKPGKLKGLKSLINKNYNVTDIGRYYGVEYGSVIREIRRQGLTLPLKDQMKKKLGAKLECIRKSLIAGIPKSSIMKQYGCSSEAIVLIELDQPELSKIHHKTVRLMVTEKHRRTLLNFLVEYPDSGRSAVVISLPTCYDHLIQFDKEWFYKQIPERKKAKQTKQRSSRNNWALMDTEKSQELEQVVNQLYNCDGKPVRVTKNGLLKRISLKASYHDDPSKFPLVEDILTLRTESYDKFLVRRITWAVKQYEIKDNGLSINTLRRVSGINAQPLRENKQLINDLAKEFGVELEKGSFFSKALADGDIS